MKNIITLIVTLLVACTNLFAQTTPVKMMTYNIKGHTMSDAKIQNIAKVINTVAPDIVSVQEIYNKNLIVDYDYFADLATATGMQATFFPLVENNYGIGILSKVKPIKVDTQKFPSTDPNNKYPEDRGYLIAEFEDYIFIATHYPTSALERDVMAEWMVNYVKTTTKTVFLAGDFNAAPTYRAVVTLKNAGFVISSNTDIMSYPSDAPTKLIDMILQYSNNEGNKKYSVVASAVPEVTGMDLTTVSDHLPVYMEMQEDTAPVENPYLVTTPVMDAGAKGSLLNVLASIPDNTGVTVRFRLDSDELPFNVTRVLLENKKVVIDGKNMETGNRIKVSGGSTFLEFKNCDMCRIMNMEISNFKGIAIKSSGSKFSAENCLFADNKDGSVGGNNGGVARLSGTFAQFVNCDFTGNTARGSYGGGALCLYGKGAGLDVDNCRFIKNETNCGSTGAVDGGGTISICSGSAVIKNSIFTENTSNTNGGAIKVWTRNSTYDVPKLKLSNCTFDKNAARSGGAVVVYGTRYIDHSIEFSAVNCTFGNNKCNDRGGALYIANENEGVKDATGINGNLMAVVVNNTFAGNMTAKATSADGGALAFWGRSKSVNGCHVVNNIFAHNYFSKAIANQHNDARFFSTKGLVAKNNIYDEGDFGFSDATKGYAVLNPDHGNISYNGTTDKLFMYPTANPWNADWESAELSGDIKVIVLAVESIAAEKGLATYVVDGVEYVPVKDQSGIDRGGKPSVGAIQNGTPTSVEDIEVAEVPAIVKAGSELVLANPEELYIFDVSGRLVQVSPAAERISIKELPNGIYVAKAGNCIVKFVK